MRLTRSEETASSGTAAAWGANATSNLGESALMAAALLAGEASLGRGGTFLAETGRFTGRSPKDKHIVLRSETESDVWWDGNARMTPDAFERVRADMLEHPEGRGAPHPGSLGRPGCRTRDRRQARDRTRLACALPPPHADPPPSGGAGRFVADWTILNLPSFHADPSRHGCRSETVIARDWETRTVLIGGTDYAGENKKAVFTILNWILPAADVMPMHCSANHAPGNPSDAAIFFGLSGTGKTTLSSDPGRTLVGDDEHGWSARGVLPPIARLAPAQATYHFLSGFTSKVAGTERGVNDPEATFSTCFGAPFLPRRPEVYGKLLAERMARRGAACWLVNTGWTGGAYGAGTRMPIGATRALLGAALSGRLSDWAFRSDPFFGFEVPLAVEGVDPSLLDPRSTGPTPRLTTPRRNGSWRCSRPTSRASRLWWMVTRGRRRSVQTADGAASPRLRLVSIHKLLFFWVF